ncbi:hypothetical protein J437_LFUL000869 [Ladona fulva]|uniref:Nuclear speckle splicing regulatory protein 1 N-terminal domain-containing protein n=1 Tax=Ladona fulva TaxID=123851 RepID=A0A8K0JUF2_LADFU|nr:hypothetical protein J437_LFUL000869 [Ladona fulva]
MLLPKKANQNFQARPSIFGDDSDSDSGEGARSVGKSFKNASVQKRQTQLDIKKALEQDPTVYQYDEVYDAMEEKKLEQKSKKKDPEKKPKYIQALLVTAERRKREQERRTERKVQKEREAEGEEFKDKESFVTSAYRKKLEEFQRMDEEERLQDRIEELTDVAKQKDLSGFYRHLYQQKVCDGEDSTHTVKIKEEKDEEKIPLLENVSEDVEEKPPLAETYEESSQRATSKPEERRYRKRKMSSSDESDGEKDVGDKRGKVEEGSDADSDSSSSESSSGSSSESSSSSEGSGEDEPSGKSKVENGEGEKMEENEGPKPQINSDEKVNEVNYKMVNGDVGEQKTDSVKEGDEEVQENIPEEPKPNIWEKKTVGLVFEEALQRYLARKAARMAAES